MCLVIKKKLGTNAAQTYVDYRIIPFGSHWFAFRAYLAFPVEYTPINRYYKPHLLLNENQDGF